MGATGVRSPAEGAARLVVVEGDVPGRKFTINRQATLGRSSRADVTVHDREVSREHARIARCEKGFVLEDLGSQNGTFVDEVPVSRKLLAMGDKIRLGPRVVLVFTRRDPIEEVLQQRQRLESLGRLTAGVAHDFNNMVGAVTAAAECLAGVLEDETMDRDVAADCVADMQAAASRAAALSRSLLDFAKGANSGHRVVDLGALCKDLVKLVRRTFPHSTRIVLDAQPGLAVEGDATELQQILMNLCVNGRDAMTDGGTLHITARRARPDEGPPVGSVERGRVVVSVGDTGVGIDEETRKRIFEPFYTTKPRGAGFGVGLSTVRELVNVHGGSIEVASEPGVGTRFDVFLPKASTSGALPTETTTQAPPVMPRGGIAGSTVLLVDDEPVVRRSLARLLRRAGAEVVEACDGRAGVERFASLDERPDVVLFDLDMPRLTGDEAHRELESVHGHVPVVFMSGRGSAPEIPPETTCLRKPCTGPELLMALAEALDSVPSEGEEETGAHTMRSVRVAAARVQAQGGAVPEGIL